MPSIIQMLDFIKKKPSAVLTPEISANLLEIKKICDHKYSDQSYYGNAALNRQMLLDPDIARLLSPEVISYLFTNAPTQETTIYRNSTGSTTLQDAIFYGFKDGLNVIKFIPNNEPFYNHEAYDRQKIEFSQNTMRIANNISLAAGIGLIQDEQAPQTTALIAQYERIVNIINALRPTKSDLLLQVPGYSAGNMRAQVQSGFSRLQELIGIVNPQMLDQETLDSFCEKFLQTPKAMLDGIVIHLFYDRAHIDAALEQNTIYHIGGQPYTFQDIFRMIVKKIATHPENYPVCAQEQISLRLGLVEKNLEECFPLEYTNAIHLEEIAEHKQEIAQQSLQQCLGGFHSDHTDQSIRVKFVPGVSRAGIQLFPRPSLEPFTITGMTLNCMNKGHSKASCRAAPGVTPYSNNPFDLDENDEEYIHRLQEQSQFLLERIGRRDIQFCFLQEASWLLPYQFSRNKQIQDIQIHFIEKLHELGWSIITTQKTQQVKPLVTLFNAQVLHPKNTGLGVIPTHTGKNTGFLVDFDYQTDNPSHAVVPIRLVNLHLDFSEDSRQSILDLQHESIRDRIAMIAGGDTNHPQNLDQMGLIGNWNFPSNIDSDSSGALSIHDPRAGQLLKRYDGFFVSPTDSSGNAHITEGPGHYFEFDDLTKKVKIAILDPAKQYRDHYQHTLPELGTPWIRHKIYALLKEHASKDSKGVPQIESLFPKHESSSTSHGR